MSDSLPKRSCLTLVLILGLTAGGFAVPICHADEVEEASLSYGRGVQLYFDGSASEAVAFLTRSIELNPADPRPYYFRAMALVRQGRNDEARLDMQTGAQMEAFAPGRYPVDAALERVQGSSRLLLEEYRRNARINAASVRQQQQQARYEQQSNVEAQVSRKPIRIMLEGLVQPSSAEQMAIGPAGPSPEHASGAWDAQGESKTAASDAQPIADMGDPFADDAQQPADATRQGGDGKSGKIKAGTLLDVFGRAVRNTLPLPELPDGLQPAIGPATGGDADPFGGAESTPSDFDFGAGEAEPSFNAPEESTTPADEQPGAEDSFAPFAPSDEEDPFGNF